MYSGFFMMAEISAYGGIAGSSCSCFALINTCEFFGAYFTAFPIIF